MTVNQIVATDLVVDYATPTGPVRALDCARLDVEGGHSVAVMGASGCGKSTLLGLLAGLAVPTSGSVTVGDTRVSSLDEPARVLFRRQMVGMVYQSDNLLPHLTVQENVGLQWSICRGSTPRRERGDPRAVLEPMGLGQLTTRLPDQLSGGQRQRVAVARAVVVGPNVILADEPTGSLDAASATTVIELLVQVHQEIGATLVVVTHDPAIAAHLEATVHLATPRPVGAHDAR